MYVCVNVCMYVYVCVLCMCVCVCMYVCIYTFLTAVPAAISLPTNQQCADMASICQNATESFPIDHLQLI